MLLDGVHVPLLTPFYPDGRVYLRKLEHNVRRYSLTPVSGLIALGPASEATALTEAEQREVLRTVAETASPEKVLIATLQHPGCLPSLAMAEYAAGLDFDALLLQAPAEFAFHGTEAPAELLTWFRVLADGSPLPVLLASHVGSVAIPVPVLAALAEHPNVLGVYEQSLHISRVADFRALTERVQREVTTTITFTAATGRMLRPAPQELAAASTGFVSAASLTGGTAVAPTPPAAPAIRTRTKQVGSQVLWAHATDATGALRAGVAGIAPQTAASMPQAVFEIWAAWKDGDAGLMREKQERVVAAEPTLLQSGAPLLKAAAELSGYFGGRPRLPLVAPTAAEQQALAVKLDGIRS